MAAQRAEVQILFIGCSNSSCWALSHSKERVGFFKNGRNPTRLEIKRVIAPCAVFIFSSFGKTRRES